MTGLRKRGTRIQYGIRVKGALDSRWADWFGGLTLRVLDNDETLLEGPVADQAALHGILAKIRDLGLELLAVTRFGAGGDDLCSSLDQEAKDEND
ncbi:MAG: hypothetical protein MUC85_01620 [Anaerolineales bacterium]|jgi:hypothetical protein|nr:hypothetical protein [Anaerolineales bacterium]